MGLSSLMLCCTLRCAPLLVPIHPHTYFGTFPGLCPEAAPRELSTTLLGDLGAKATVSGASQCSGESSPSTCNKEVGAEGSHRVGPTQKRVSFESTSTIDRNDQAGLHAGHQDGLALSSLPSCTNLKVHTHPWTHHVNKIAGLGQKTVT